ncbi:MAG: TylF/MycF/NovP-related O-methyltransferase [bacterium]|nr:TylF/MycF/NovP-related O-methyltransferase [bacterium]
MRKLIQSTLRKFGYTIVSAPKEMSDIPPDMDRAFQRIFRQCKPYTMTSIERMYALYKAVEYIVRADVPGSLVECGVWKGGSVMMMASTLKRMQETKRMIYLYDTFAGMTKPTRIDRSIYSSQPAIQVWRKTQERIHNAWNFVSLPEVKQHVFLTGYPKRKFVFVQGKVEETIPATIPSRIALLRLDTDWFTSTYHELTHLFPRLSRGGILIIDDYGDYVGARRATDRYFREQKIFMLLQRIDAGGRLGVK